MDVSSAGRKGLVTRSEAEAVGIEALSFLAQDPKLLSRFLALSGLSAMQLRERATDPAFFAGLLDFLLGHEPTLLAFSAASGTEPPRVVAARRALAGDFEAPPE